MPVYNLGQFGQPRESDLSGLSEALGSGLERGAQLRDIKSKESYYKLQRAQLETKEKQQSMERADFIATQLTTMDENKRNQFLQTPAGQETVKALKKDAPWAVDENGRFVPVSNKKVYETTMKASEEKLTGMKVALGEKLQRNEQLTQEEQQLAQMFKMGKDQTLKQVQDAALLEAMDQADKGKKDAWSDENVKSLIGKYRKFYDASTQADSPPQNPYGSGLGTPPAQPSNFVPTAQPPQPAVPQGTVPNQATAQKVPNYRIVR